MNAPRPAMMAGHGGTSGSGALGSGPLGRCATVAMAVIAVDIGSKIAATSLLGDSVVPTGGGSFLGVVYNDGFARGVALGSLAVPATLLLAAVLLLVIGRVCAPLAAVDAAAPRALGFVAGAAAANALDFVRTGRGVVDFLGFPTAQGAIVFNLADVAAYIGVVLLARTAWLVARAAWQERTVGEPLPRYPRLHAAARMAWAQRGEPGRHLELVRPVPIFVEDPPAPVPADAVVPVPGAERPAGPVAPARHAPPYLGDVDLTPQDRAARPTLSLVVSRPRR